MHFYFQKLTFKEKSLAVVSQSGIRGAGFWLSIVRVLFAVLALSIVHNAYAQQVIKSGTEATSLSFPWTGGLDACQFGVTDVDHDGIKDLILFDRRGNRLLCFRNRGLRGSISMEYAPEYEQYFPEMFEWMILVDFNQDGREDIFTYSPQFAGIQVYQNIGSEHIEFKRIVYPYLTSFQGTGEVNILATNADYPAIVDVDADGDLDLITFWALGGYMELNQNQSVDKYGTADSLEFKKTDYCWGRVGENEENNVLYLDTCLFNPVVSCFSAENQSTDKGLDKEISSRHRGATIAVRELNGDGLLDCVLADVDYPNLVLLVNGGDDQSALFVSQDTSFPSVSSPVRLFSMPVTGFFDVDNDGDDDLLVSSFDPNPRVTMNTSSIWLYRNIGTNDNPVFQLVSKDFLQSSMIDAGSVSLPLFCDLNHDGLMDLVIGNDGYYQSSYYEGGVLQSNYLSKLSYYQNIGSEDQAIFCWQTDDLAGLSRLGARGLAPSAGDLDGNGTTDLLLGTADGTLIIARQLTDGQWIIDQQQYQSLDAGPSCTPQLFDLDQDGITDLVCGSENGKITFFKGRNNNESIDFDKITNYLGEIDVTDYTQSYSGFSTPFFYYTFDNELQLVVGAENGRIRQFNQIHNNLTGVFQEIELLDTLLDTIVRNWDLGARSSVSVADLNQDGKPEMVCGNYGGGVQLFHAQAKVMPGIQSYSLQPGFSFYPQPVRNTLSIKLDHSTNFSLRILNMKMQIVKQIQGAGSELDWVVDDLVSGSYLLELKSEGRCTRKIMLKW